MRAGAHGPGNFAHRHNVPHPDQPLQRPAKLIVHQCQLESKRGGLGLDAVAAANARRELVLLRAFRDGDTGGLDIRDQQIRALHHLNGVTGVAHVAAGEAEMKPAAGLVIDFFRHRRGEADDIMVQRLFQFPLPGHQAGKIRQPRLATRLDLLKIGGRDHPLFHQGFAGQKFNLQPDAQFVFVRPNGPHFRARITLNHKL